MARRLQRAVSGVLIVSGETGNRQLTTASAYWLLLFSDFRYATTASASARFM